MQVVGGVAGVQRPAHAGRGHPVHAGPPADSGSATTSSSAASVRLGRAGHHHGQVGLDAGRGRPGRAAARPAPGPRRRLAGDASAPGRTPSGSSSAASRSSAAAASASSSRPYEVIAPSPVTPSSGRLGERLAVGRPPGPGCGAAPARRAAPSTSSAVGAVPGVQLGEHAEHGPPGGRRAGPFRLRGEHGDRPVPLVALPDQPRLAGHRQPGAGPGRSQRWAMRGGPPHVVARRWAGTCWSAPARLIAWRRSASTSPTSPAAYATSSSSAAVGSSSPAAAGQPAQVTDAEAAGAQHRGRLGGERLQQRLGVPYRLHRLPGAGRVDRLRLPRTGRWRSAGAGCSGPSGPVSRRSSRPTSRGSSTSSPPARRPASEIGTSSALSTSQRTGDRPSPASPARSVPTGGPAASRSSTARAAGGAASTVRRSRAGSAQSAAAPRVQLRRRAGPDPAGYGEVTSSTAGDHLQRVLRAVQQEPGARAGRRRPGRRPGRRPAGRSAQDRVDRGQRRRPGPGSAGPRRGSAG